jgi:hypothetical protein
MGRLSDNGDADGCCNGYRLIFQVSLRVHSMTVLMQHLGDRSSSSIDCIHDSTQAMAPMHCNSARISSKYKSFLEVEVFLEPCRLHQSCTWTIALQTDAWRTHTTTSLECILVTRALSHLYQHSRTPPL